MTEEQKFDLDTAIENVHLGKITCPETVKTLICLIEDGDEKIRNLENELLETKTDLANDELLIARLELDIFSLCEKLGTAEMLYRDLKAENVELKKGANYGIE